MTKLRPGPVDIVSRSAVGDLRTSVRVHDIAPGDADESIHFFIRNIQAKQF